jgi:hypothetical protein
MNKHIQPGRLFAGQAGLRALLGAGLLVLALLGAWFVPHALAATNPFQVAVQDCATSPDALLCNNQDPIAQGCVSRATQTVESRPILYQGKVVGRLDLRYDAARCHSYWGRASAYIPGDVHIGILIPFDSWYTAETHSAYSNMVFARRPEISGTIDVSATAVAAAAIL